MQKIKVWQRIVLGVTAFCVLAFLFFYAHWFSYRMAAKHMDMQIIYPVLATVILLPHVIGVWVLTVLKKKNPFWAMLLSIFFAGVFLGIFAGFNGDCPMCAYPPDRVYQWLRTLFYGHPLECTW